ncbi:MAG: hypothetical protein BWY74_00335 [Firmicutes bacterium ADurb.Bin419]|nr:MAG: hypothetical protein BWY74_00335 [Firmicutes bacterium ADurb.Bin419]
MSIIRIGELIEQQNKSMENIIKKLAKLDKINNLMTQEFLKEETKYELISKELSKEQYAKK